MTLLTVTINDYYDYDVQCTDILYTKYYKILNKIAVEEGDVHEYDNDSFIIDDDGKEGDLTGSSPEVSAAEKSSKKQKTKVSMELEES